MPTYVYACKNCDHRFEQYQSFSEDSLVTCPECTQDTLRKVFDSVGIVFKGPGFYSTDSQSSTKGGIRSHGAESSTTSSGSSESASASSGAPGAGSDSSSSTGSGSAGSGSAGSGSASSTSGSGSTSSRSAGEKSAASA